ncbi:T-box protein H15 isoform X2 [Drosophila ananassae]|uniref:T-box protein H15 isoform X2 n=1 Tax=Drosophila ananassae TaxID=7217 RepID=UPI001D00120C|nr:T-box protein H15 isoform X2 [Drosophila ananassae]
MWTMMLTLMWLTAATRKRRRQLQQRQPLQQQQTQQRRQQQQHCRRSSKRVRHCVLHSNISSNNSNINSNSKGNRHITTQRQTSNNANITIITTATPTATAITANQAAIEGVLLLHLELELELLPRPRHHRPHRVPRKSSACRRRSRQRRRMFPTVRVSFSGPLRQIQPPDRYAVLLDIVPLDSRRYRYAYHRSSWLVAGKADPPPPARIYAHPDSPISPEALRKQVVSFEKVKLTNNEMDKSGQVVLNSMHRYQPRIHLVRLSHGQSIPGNPKELQDMDHKTFVFPETVFTAVTAYQNQLITKLKIDSNPFAKGFRDSSRLTDFDRDPMDAFFFDQHMRAAPLRFFPDPLMSQLTPQEADAASLALLEKARQHLQMFGRSPYTEMLLPHLYQRSAAPPPPPPAPPLSAFQLGMWQQQWPQLTAGFLASANQQAALALAAAGANRTPPPPPAVAPPAPATPTSSCGSASPDLRARPQLSHYPQRFSPYQVPQHQASPPASNRAESP